MDKIAILMLEDSHLDADLTRLRLEKAGIHFSSDRVQTREDFESALNAKTYELILADYVLPSFSGVEALEIARRIAPDVPFIFVSGMLGEEVAIDMLQRGATDYVLKNKLERLGPAVIRALSEVREKEERRRTEMRLRESERRYRILVGAVPQLIWTCTPDGQCDFLNPQWVEFTGRPEDEQLGLRWLEQVHPDDRERANRIWFESVKAGRTFDTEYRLRKANGAYRWMKARAVAVKDAHSRVEKWFGSSTDIQDQKEAEEELRRRTEALARSNSDLQQFAYVASHDLQEPLRSVISYTQLLQRRYQGRLDADADEFIGYAVEGANRMQKLIHDLLEYSRATADRTDVKEDVPVAKALNMAIGRMSTTLDGAGARVEFGELPVVRARLPRMAQVFENLLSNAVKYQRPGVPPLVNVSASRDGTDWVIAVKDNGIGFEPDFADRIFGIFQRLHGRHVPGTGMGLALCKRIVESNGGRIWAESASGEGATFFFTVPDSL
ncbi:MAG: PAS domain-containing protein [Acidobacteriaceae bacterium]|nr:PAS domain-containing protein [Acidobacteriaceae bacterium]